MLCKPRCKPSRLSWGAQDQRSARASTGQLESSTAVQRTQLICDACRLHNFPGFLQCLREKCVRVCGESRNRRRALQNSGLILCFTSQGISPRRPFHQCVKVSEWKTTNQPEMAMRNEMEDKQLHSGMTCSVFTL